MRVLIVEDQALIALSLRISLLAAGHAVIGPASTSAEALSLARDSRPDLAFVDVDLEAKKAGLNVAHQLATARVPVIFATGQVDPVRKSGLGLGVLAKPYDPEEATHAVAWVQAVMHGQTADSPRSLVLLERSTLTNQPPPPILLVEDHPRDVELSIAAFDAAHVVNPIHVARDGQEALNQLAPVCGDPSRRPALVLLDLKMPRLSGFDVLERARQEPALRSLPFVVFTSSEDERDVRRSYELGANAVIGKPRDFVEFKRTLGTVAHFWSRCSEQSQKVT